MTILKSWSLELPKKWRAKDTPLGTLKGSVDRRTRLNAHTLSPAPNMRSVYVVLAFASVVSGKVLEALDFRYYMCLPPK